MADLPTKEVLLVSITAQSTTTTPSSEECPVCYEATSQPFKTTCEHILCVECADHWFKSSHTCPSCRTPVYKKPAPAEVEEDNPNPTAAERFFRHEMDRDLGIHGVYTQNRSSSVQTAILAYNTVRETDRSAPPPNLDLRRRVYVNWRHMLPYAFGLIRGQLATNALRFRDDPDVMRQRWTALCTVWNAMDQALLVYRWRNMEAGHLLGYLFQVWWQLEGEKDAQVPEYEDQEQDVLKEDMAFLFEELVKFAPDAHTPN